MTFAFVERLPVAGEIVGATEVWEEAAGGGGVAAVQLARLAGGCAFYTALGGDAEGSLAAARLTSLGASLFAAPRERTRRAFVHTDVAGERTITVLGERVVPFGADPLPWGELGACDAVYVTGGDAEAVRLARACRVLVATPRASDALAAAGVPVDVLVLSGSDADEVRWCDEVLRAGVPVGAIVRTAGAEGGVWEVVGVAEGSVAGAALTAGGEGGESEAGAARSTGSRGTWAAAPLSGPVVDAYGCGDSFAAGLTFALGGGASLADAVAYGARCGAVCLTGAGPYGAALTP